MNETENSSKNTISANEVSLLACDRLLNAAESLFAERGYDGTSIRDITAKADCNLAAVNYHFHSKDNLYTEVFRRRLQLIRNTRLESIESSMNEDVVRPDLKKLLRSFAKTFIGTTLENSTWRNFMRLMTREMLDNHLPSNLFYEEIIAHIQPVMVKALVKLCPGLTEPQAARSLFSIVGQLIHAIHLKEMFSKVENIDLPIFDLDKYLDHIVEFSAAGILGMAKQGGQ